jgi:hypothetical protein
MPAGHSPPPQVASHATPLGTQTQSLKNAPSRNGTHVLPASQLPPHVGNPEPPVHGIWARQKHSPGNATSLPQVYDTGHAPGHVAVGAPGTQILPASTHAHVAEPTWPKTVTVDWHFWPAPQLPPQVGNCNVLQGPGTVVVVVAAAHPVAPQASQQLAADPAQACPPAGAVHDAALRLIVHFVRPFASVRQHVAAPGRPHVERAAQRFTGDAHSARSCPVDVRIVATAAAQRTWSPWRGAPLQSQSVATCARAAATAAASPGSSPHRASADDAVSAMRRRTRIVAVSPPSAQAARSSNTKRRDAPARLTAPRRQYRGSGSVSRRNRGCSVPDRDPH